VWLADRRRRINVRHQPASGPRPEPLVDNITLPLRGIEVLQHDVDDLMRTV